MDLFNADGYWLARWLFERGVAAIYLIAFLAARNQFAGVLGDGGLTPIREQLGTSTFWERPSLFYWLYSERLFRIVAWAGIVLSTAALFGIVASAPVWLHMSVWLTLWLLYLSIVNVGGRFYGFGWETMTLEAGFFMAFFGPDHVAPAIVPVLLIRWLLFRVEFGAGLIKLRHDPCWRNLTCLDYHYETQPLPNPLSWYFHRLPKPFHRVSVLFSHVVQVIVPFGLFAPQPVAAIAGGLIVFHQFWLIVSGNYAWLNWLTVVLAIPALPDSLLAGLFPVSAPAAPAPRPAWFDVVLAGVAILTVALSVKPTLNFFSPAQRMNASYNPLHLVNAYGAFGSVTKQRHEVIIEGTRDAEPSPDAVWREYEFKGKPGDPARRPSQVAPYHLRLDWLMWFLPLSVRVTESGARVPGYERWFARLVEKLLAGDPSVLELLRTNPFPDEPPRWVRARFFRYRFTSAAERKETGRWWDRSLVDEYLDPMSRRDV
ncbi:MAG: lipase maturation factor family protein [Rhodothermales bacterium]